MDILQAKETFLGLCEQVAERFAYTALLRTRHTVEALRTTPAMNGPDLPPPGSIPSYPGGGSQSQPPGSPPPQPVYHPPQSYTGGPPPTDPGGGKKTPWPWIIGGCGGCLILTIIAFGIVAAIGYTTVKKAAQDSPGPFTQTGGMTTYTNEVSSIPEGLKPHFSRFTFQYPDHFTVVPDESNFVKVEEQEDGFTLENFAVGYMSVNSGTTNEDAYPVLMQQLSQQIAKGFQEYQELGQFPETIGGVRGRGMRWKAVARNTPKGDVQFFGYVLLARKEVRPKGVAIIMIATNLDPEIKTPQDVGTKGDLASILPTFRLD